MEEAQARAKAQAKSKAIAKMVSCRVCHQQVDAWEAANRDTKCDYGKCRSGATGVGDTCGFWRNMFSVRLDKVSLTRIVWNPESLTASPLWVTRFLQHLRGTECTFIAPRLAAFAVGTSARTTGTRTFIHADLPLAISSSSDEPPELCFRCVLPRPIVFRNFPSNSSCVCLIQISLAPASDKMIPLQVCRSGWIFLGLFSLQA